MARKPQQSKRKRTIKKYTKGLKYYKNLSDRQSAGTGESTCNLQNVTISVCCENCIHDIGDHGFYPCKRCFEFDQFKAK